MNRPFNYLSQKDIRTLLKRIIVVSAIFIGIIFILNTYIDFEEIHRSLSFPAVLGYQAVAIVTLLLLEALIISAVLWEWSRSRPTNISHINRLLKDGENENSEFKASLRWDYKRKEVNKELEYVAARAIAGFMNAKGGTLLIGVGDEKELIGLDTDYNTLKKKDSDGFLIHLAQILNSYFGKEFSSFWTAHIIRDRNKDICRIDILPADRPVYVRHDNQEEFFVRVSATTQPMQMKEAYEYIKTHWKK